MQVTPEHLRRAGTFVTSPADDPHDRSARASYLQGVHAIVQHGETLRVGAGPVALYAETHEDSEETVDLLTAAGGRIPFSPADLRSLAWAALAVADAVEGV